MRQLLRIRIRRAEWNGDLDVSRREEVGLYDYFLSLGALDSFVFSF